MEVKKLLGRSVIMVKLFRESVVFAFSQLRGDKFRTFLSLFGVSVGIFTIVAIFTAIVRASSCGLGVGIALE